MGLARRESRPITVDGASYRWKVRGSATYAQSQGWTPLEFAVESGAGAKLVVQLPAYRPDSWGGPQMTVRPRFVATCIQRARHLGWRPDEPGKPFTLRVEPWQVPAEDFL